MLPEPHSAAPGSASEEDNWSWLVTFSDLVLQLFGVAIIAALGGAAAHGAAAHAPVALGAVASAPASAPQVVTRTPTEPEVAAAPARSDEPEADLDAAPQAVSDAADAVPVLAPAVAATVATAPQPTRPAVSAQRVRMAALGTYVAHLVALQADLAATVTTHDDDVVVKIGDVAGFAPGSAEPSRAMRPLLAELRTIVAASPDLQVEISGHTDDVAIKTPLFPSNLELSLARASRVAHELVATDSALWSRVSAAGYGEQRPTASNGDAAGRSRNRRVEIRLARVP